MTGVWALFEQQPAWVFTFPNNTNDAIFHLVGAALFAAVALIQIGTIELHQNSGAAARKFDAGL